MVRFVEGEQVRVDTRSGEAFYGVYLRWRPTQLYEHLVRLVRFAGVATTGRLRVGDEVKCTDNEVQSCAFVAKPPTSIEDIERLLEG